MKKNGVLNGADAITRETAISYRQRPLMVTLKPRMIEVREKGRQDAVAVPYDAIYELGLKMRARQNGI